MPCVGRRCRRARRSTFNSFPDARLRRLSLSFMSFLRARAFGQPRRRSLGDRLKLRQGRRRDIRAFLDHLKVSWINPGKGSVELGLIWTGPGRLPRVGTLFRSSLGFHSLASSDNTEEARFLRRPLCLGPEVATRPAISWALRGALPAADDDRCPSVSVCLDKREQRRGVCSV